MSCSTYINSHILRKMYDQGFLIALIKILVHLLPKNRRTSLEQLKINLIKRKIRKEKINITPSQRHDTSVCNNIWICWLQGERNMPALVQMCYDSIRKHSNGHPVVLITYDNYSQYVILPHRIVTLYNQGTLLPALFADMIRIHLLAQHGGLWLDATIWVKDDIPNDWFQQSFFSMKFNPDIIEVSKRRWVSYCLGRGKTTDVFFNKAVAFFEDYLSRHDYFLDYFMIDYAFDYIYEFDTDARSAVDSVPYNNTKTSGLLRYLCSDYSEQLFKQLTDGTTFFKLRWRKDEESEADLIGNGKTIYCHIKELTYSSFS